MKLGRIRQCWRIAHQKITASSLAVCYELLLELTAFLLDWQLSARSHLLVGFAQFWSGSRWIDLRRYSSHSFSHLLNGLRSSSGIITFSCGLDCCLISEITDKFPGLLLSCARNLLAILQFGGGVGKREGREAESCAGTGRCFESDGAYRIRRRSLCSIHLGHTAH